MSLSVYNMLTVIYFMRNAKCARDEVDNTMLQNLWTVTKIGKGWTRATKANKCTDQESYTIIVNGALEGGLNELGWRRFRGCDSVSF